MRDIRELEAKYIKLRKGVVDNANLNIAYTSLMDYIFGEVVCEQLEKIIPVDVARAHRDGWIYIHKLPHSLWIPYCMGWQLLRIAKYGLKTPSIIASPPKHFLSFIKQVENFTFLAQLESTGAQAYSAIDLYSAPFIACDKLDEREVKQVIQSYLYAINTPMRIGFQTPFVNVTIVLDTVKGFLEADAYVGGKVVGALGDYLDSAILFAKCFLQLLIEGDARRQPFTFPIPTLMVTENFDWNGSRWGELTYKIFENLSEVGSPYILNGYATDVSAIYAMCCRLNIDVKKIGMRTAARSFRVELDEVSEMLRKRKAPFGVWAIPDATGSIGVITINLPRLGYLAKGEWDRLFEMLDEELSLARKMFAWWRKRYEYNLSVGLMPILKEYLGHLNWHYNTIGVLGLPEFAANFLGDPKLWEEASRRDLRDAIDAMVKVLRHIKEVIAEFEEEDGYLYNVEEVPAEAAAHKLAAKDAARFPDMYIPGRESTPFYSNSIVPYYAQIPLMERVYWEAQVQPEFTGGVMCHIFLGHKLEPDEIKKLVYNVCTQTKLVYFSITPVISVCPTCGYREVGVLETCPKCKSTVDVWARVVGYYRPLSSWYAPRREEFKTRKLY